MSEHERFDLHVHTRFSPDGRIRIASVVEQLGVAGLKGFALTDHNTVAGHPHLKEIAARYPRYTFLPAVEVSTREGHLLLYGVSESPPIHRPLAETLEWAEARRAVPVLSHPFRWAHGVGRHLAETARVAGIEAMNGHNGEVANAKAELVAARRRISETGGSDAHELNDIGTAFTEFPEGTTGVEEVLECLRRGQCRAAGRSLPAPQRLRLALMTLARRAGRGFRPI
ncbi:MAG: CehA/McbA family metallohydrolase [Thermoplasmata archaeon]|nr:CehA/McbA family metallohydrolase [Thermoplasmata archaeon]